MKQKTLIIAVALATALMFAGCGHGHSHDDKHEHGEEAEAGHADATHFTKKQAEEAGLKTEKVTRQAFCGVISTSGEIQAVQGDEQTIAATADGIVYFRNASITEGTAVKKGEAIVTISAKDLQDGDPIAKARAEYEAAEKEYERAEKLVADKIISEKAFEEIRLRRETAKAAYAGQARNVTAKGVSVSSSMNGYVKSRLVGQGEYVTVGQPIMVVSQNRRLQLRADVPESGFRQLRNIKSANFKLSYDDKVYCLDSINGNLLSYGKTAAGAPYIPVTFEFDNVGDVVPGAFAEVYLLTDAGKDIISVPLSAIVEEQGLFFVYLQVGSEDYKKQEVQTGQSDGRRVEIVKGLKDGDMVVTEGAYQLKLATTSAVIPGHSHEH
ncbi:MAG: efflux RND transporter periplasmic adaptor subunit [Prevotella sp.]|nr:efflux RND transporter periplasmic adaptor subunit [Prevotella sp.]